MGGIYYLTIDEVTEKNGIHLIQESKNSTKGFLPSLADIQDGLFKLILYSNLDSLKLNSEVVEFQSCLKLTGSQVLGALEMPCDESSITDFLHTNREHCRSKEAETLYKLNQEALSNQKLVIQISSNSK